MFLNNAWYVACLPEDLDEKPMVSLTILGKPIIVYKTTKDEFIALENRCCHRFAPLSEGRIEGDNVRCMYHGLLYNSDGKVIEIPGQESVTSGFQITRYPAVNHGGWVWIWMGDPEQATEDALPHVRGLRDGGWLLKPGSIDYQANYQLINNNLTDLGHLTWVHASSFKADNAWATTIPDVSAINRGVRINRWLKNIAPIPPLGRAAEHERVDQWAQLDYVAPGVFLFYNAAYPAGTAEARYSDGEPDANDPDLLFDSYSQQAVTPLTEKTTRYFFSWGPGSKSGSWADADLMEEMAGMAFSEDRQMIEAQQKIIDMDPDLKPKLIIHDRGVVLFQRQMEKLMAAEREAVKVPDTASE